MEGRHTYRASPEFNGTPPGTLRRVTATREVILAGGTFNTPQLLQLSGIGPAALLEKHGIPVLVDLPGVGANLQDRYEVSVVNRLKQPLRLLEGATMRPPVAPAAPDRFLRQWIDTGAGVYTSNGAVIGIVKKSKPSRPDPDVLIFGLATNFRGYYPRYSDDVSNARDYFTWTILKGYTRNTAGRVAIRSSNPQDVPDINFSYFDQKDDPDGEDLNAVVDAIRFARAMTDPYRAKYVVSEEVPGDALQTPDQLRQFVCDNAWGHHASGTCKIGRPDDPMAVLDSKFRVYGTKSLRVVDASIFPRIPGLFIVAAVYTAAEKASDVISADVGHPAGERS
jgi:choline dehydrogenase